MSRSGSYPTAHPSDRAFVPKPRSAFAISITPFTEAGHIDEGAFRAHLHRLAEAKIGVYVAGGGSGEAYSLTVSERRRVIEIAVEELAGRVPIRAMGVEPRTADEMIAFAQMSEAAGADAVQVYSLELGHGKAPGSDEVEDYLTTVLDVVTAPLILSTHKSVGYVIPVPLLVRLADRYPHIIGINCSHNDLNYVQRLVDAMPPRVEVHVGGPSHAAAALCLGATGFLSTEANIAPRLCRLVIEAFEGGDMLGFHDAYARLLRLSNVTYATGGVRATKSALRLLGLPGGYPRRPRLPADAGAEKLIGIMLDQIDIAQIERLADAWPASRSDSADRPTLGEH